MFSASKSGQYGGYQISRSVRTRSSASAYFNRTPASASNRKTWTWSGWVKRGTLGAAQVLMSSDVGTSNTTWLEFGFDAADTFTITSYATDSNTTSAVFRDPSSWYHVVVQFDSTQATAANRCRIYINGVQQTLTGAGFTLNADYGINNNQIHDIGRRNWASGVGRYFDGYLTEINFIDGQALTPSSFGVTNAYGVWSPIKYNGTYGTNGFYLNFADNSSNTATTIGKDSSGNGNNWTPNNISVTSGSTYDSMLDVPTQWGDGGNGRGNYCTMNPLALNSAYTLSNANLTFSWSATTSGQYYLGFTSGVSSGKWYWEITPTDVGVGPNSTFGIRNITDTTYSQLGTAGIFANGYGYVANGNKMDNSGQSAYGASYANNDVLGFALDMDAGTLVFYKNNVSQGTAFTGISGTFLPCINYGAGGAARTGAGSVNLGQRPFTYTPPTGFRALNTQNLPTPTILKGSDYFNIALAAGASIKSTAEALFTSNELVWVKDRANVNNHQLFDSVRGLSNVLQSNTTAAETTYSAPSGNSVGWVWAEGATQGFDIVTFTAQTSGVATVAHSLGVAPSLMILKTRANVAGWFVYHKSIGATKYLAFDTAAATTSSVVWNNTDPTSSVFTMGSGFVNYGTMVAYLFAEVAGFSKFGSYTGNGSADGTFVYLGFRPRFVITKSSSTGGVGFDWSIYDSARNTTNVGGNYLWADLSNAELAADGIDFLSNGFKIRNTSGQSNQSGVTYIFAAFAENPFKYSLAR